MHSLFSFYAHTEKQLLLKKFHYRQIERKGCTQGLLKLGSKIDSLLWFSGRFLSSNVYLMVVENRAVAIDCGMPWTATRVLDYLNKNRLKLEYIFFTHSHFDHVMGASKLKKDIETKVVAHTRSKQGDVKVKNGDVLKVIDNKLSFLVVHTGVHKADHVWYYESNNQVLFIGDHLPTSTDLETLREKHGAKPKIILPGHGEPVSL
jgi:glyoxylase-like metal-dependent hydrolase (beta-lactamase superfamily II)